MPSETSSPATDPLGDPALRRSLEDFVRRRVPADDVDDVVQTVLCDALAAAGRPGDPGELKRWLLGIARHKVADRHRRAHREPPAELPDIPAGPPLLEERGLVRWAEREAGDRGEAQRTLAWMARESEGEKLEAIAAEERVPAERVRQRVSRMRRWMKERWAAELAAVAMLGALVLAGWWLLHRESPVARDLPEPAPTISPEPLAPQERARTLRADALRACDRSEWRACLEGLDAARGLDPTGDEAPAIGAARTRAEEGLRSAPNDEKTPFKARPSPSAPSSAPTTMTPTTPTSAPVIDGPKNAPSDVPFEGKGKKGRVGKEQELAPSDGTPPSVEKPGVDKSAPKKPTGGTGTLGGSAPVTKGVKKRSSPALDARGDTK